MRGIHNFRMISFQILNSIAEQQKKILIKFKYRYGNATLKLSQSLLVNYVLGFQLFLPN